MRSHRPFAPCSVVHIGYIWFGALWLALWSWGRRRGEATSLQQRYGVDRTQLLGFGFACSALAFTCAYTWYISLNHTSVAENNSIYQVRDGVRVPCA